MFEQIFEEYRKAVDSSFKVQQEMYRKWMNLWPVKPPDFDASLEADLVEGGPTKASRAQPEGSEPQRLVLEAEVDEFADTEEVADALANLCYALNAYHVAAGGNGLAIDEWQVCRRSPVGAPGRGGGRPILRCATAATYPDARTNWRAPTSFGSQVDPGGGGVSHERTP